MGETPTYRSHQPAFSPQMTARRQSVPHSLSAPSLMTSFQPKSDPILREILTQLEIIKEQQKVILLQLQSQSRIAELPDVSGFPLCTLEDLRQVTYFSLVGGLTIKETVWRVLGKMVSNTLAKTINWRGVNGKTGFESLGLKDVVSKSVRRNRVVSLTSRSP
ncbi:uncharacterized protein PEZ65_004874 [Lycodopsis pacificus]